MVILLRVVCAARLAGALALLLIASCTATRSTRAAGADSGAATRPPPAPELARPDRRRLRKALSAPAGSDWSAARLGVHRVRSGETVYSVARRYGVDAYALVSANNLVPPFDLYEGQRLRHPGSGSSDEYRRLELARAGAERQAADAPVIGPAAGDAAGRQPRCHGRRRHSRRHAPAASSGRWRDA